MKRLLIALGIIALSFLADQGGRSFLVCRLGVCTSPNVSSVSFTPLHTYFMAPTTASPAGNDGNSGTDIAHPWATPNHAVVCGDVILAQAGAYSAQTVTTNPTTCPSTTGGIDGSGGIYAAVVLCAGTDLNSCTISSSTAPWDIQANNWAIEGWNVTSSGTGDSGVAFHADGCQNQAIVVHHVIFVNNISATAQDAFGADYCATGPGVDQWAVVGNISQNSALQTTCSAAIVDVAPNNFDASAGTHVYIVGNFIWDSVSPTCITISDAEGIMFDTWDFKGYGGQGIIANNINYTADRYCVQLFYQHGTSSTPVIKVYNNTCYGDLVDTDNRDFAAGELSLNSAGTGAAAGWVISVFQNIALTDRAVSGSGNNPVYALVDGGSLWGSLTIGGTGIENILKGQQTTCNGTCDSGNNANAFNGNPLGTNIYTDPLFNNTTDLINNQNGAPNCSGFTTTVGCAGYNFSTLTLTNPSVIYDLTATCASCSGKGYQLPTNCAANSDYPTWLKGLVYLRASGFVNGATITENAGLVTKPCGM